MPGHRQRALIADDHHLVAEMCSKLLETEFTVVGIVQNGRAMVRAAGELKPDVIVVDVAMPVLNGLDAGQQVKEKWPSVKLVYLTMNPDPELAAEAFRRGASGYLLKTCACSELVAAVRAALRGTSYISRGLPKELVAYLRTQDRAEMVKEDERLTERQREVLQLLVEGKVMKEVGSILHMSARTVAFHKYKIMETLGIRCDADLVRYAIRNHIIAA
jgi:DNA-binding NarL/FixJ family response regulator